MRTKRIAAAFLLLITGCAGLIGVPDLTFDENAAQGGNEGGPNGNAEGGVPGRDGSTTGPDGEVPPTCNADLTKDPKNCGACGHE